MKSMGEAVPAKVVEIRGDMGIVDFGNGVRREVMLVAQQQLYLNLAKLLGDEVLAMSIAGLTNPEKMWSIGFRR